MPAKRREIRSSPGRTTAESSTTRTTDEAFGGCARGFRRRSGAGLRGRLLWITAAARRRRATWRSQTSPLPMSKIRLRMALDVGRTYGPYRESKGARGLDVARADAERGGSVQAWRLREHAPAAELDLVVLRPGWRRCSRRKSSIGPRHSARPGRRRTHAPRREHEAAHAADAQARMPHHDRHAGAEQGVDARVSRSPNQNSPGCRKIRSPRAKPGRMLTFAGRTAPVDPGAGRGRGRCRFRAGR